MKRLSWKPGAAIAGIGLFVLLTGILLQLTPRNLWRELFYRPLGLSAGWSLGRVVYWVGIALLAVGAVLVILSLAVRRKPAQKANPWVCAACGASNQPGSRFCAVCGKPVGTAGQEKNWRCSVCGGMNPPGAAACLSCANPAQPPVGGAPAGQSRPGFQQAAQGAAPVQQPAPSQQAAPQPPETQQSGSGFTRPGDL